LLTPSARSLCKQVSAAQVSDEEKSQQKALWFLWDLRQVGLRGYQEPDSAHRRWNNFRLALANSGLEVSCLKGTTMANWSKGPYKSGQLAFTGEECLSMFLRDNATESWLEEQGALIAQDRLLEDSIPPEAVLEIYNTFTKTRSAFALWLQRLSP